MKIILTDQPWWFNAVELYIERCKREIKANAPLGGCVLRFKVAEHYPRLRFCALHCPLCCNGCNKYNSIICYGGNNIVLRYYTVVKIKNILLESHIEFFT